MGHVNPKENIDSTTSQTTSNPDSWASPKGTGMGNQIKVDQAGATDDIYPARKERLGQYLADYTSENMANPDIRGGGKNAYPISPPGEETTRGFTDAMAFTNVSTTGCKNKTYLILERFC